MDFQPIVKWIGSKRLQSEDIIKYFPQYIDTYYEPFCGGCSVMFQFLNSNEHFANRIVCSDNNGDLIDLWNTIKKDPKGIIDEYTRMWTTMMKISDRQLKRAYFESIREEFNQTRSSYLFFFLMRTCTNGIPRYNRYGNFNNTFHITRDGISPVRLKKVLYQWHDAINNENISFVRCDYKVMMKQVTDCDFIYLDPPYELTRSTGKYFGTVDYDDIFDRLRMYNDIGIKWAMSFDSEVPGDIYENKIDIVSTNNGFNRTKLCKGNNNVFENLYLN